ncbi:MAG: hypothetical protein RSC82_07680, partial [Oscillospiraceae bacterium]
PAMFAQNINAARAALEQGACPEDPKTQKRYFEILYKTKGPLALDQKQILPALAGKSQYGTLPFASVAADFRLIETAAVALYIPQGKGAELIAELRRDGPTRKLLQQLGAYGVSIYPNQLSALLRTGAAEEIDKDLFALRDQSLYHKETGLTIEVEEGQSFIL